MRHFALLAALLAASAAHAQQPQCGDGTQAGVNLCARLQWEQADRELNRLWSVVKPAADMRGTGGLLAAQRAWLDYRDATCEAELHGGGSAAPMFYWSCMEELTRQRNAEFRAMQ